MVDRIDSGIPGLDELIEGGLPKGSTTLVSGSAGTGKTMFCSQFLWQGLQNDEKCLFITVEENSEDILEDAKEFGWDFEEDVHREILESSQPELEEVIESSKYF